MQPQALVVWGGWEGHEPEQVASLFDEILSNEGFQVEVSSEMDTFLNLDRFQNLKLIVPVITMSSISADQCQSVCSAVADQAVGISGCHGGMCDSFRENTEWQFMTGGQWVAHPGNDGVRYEVKFDTSKAHPIIDGLQDFEVVSEQYYLHVDPGNNVLAYTEFPNPEAPGPHTSNPCRMPQVWTKMYRLGRVFYCALGHQRSVIESGPARELMRRGFLWAADLL